MSEAKLAKDEPKGHGLSGTKHALTKVKIPNSERWYRLVAENMTDVIWSVNIDSPTQLNYISPSVNHLLGYTVEEAMNKTMEEIFTPASFKNAMRSLAKEQSLGFRVNRKRSLILELELRHKNGSTVAAEINYTLIQEANDRPIEILAVARDVTERKRAEEQLRQSELKYSTLVEKGNDGVLIVQDGLLKFANPMISKITGFSLQETIGRSFVDFVYPNYRSSVQNNYRKRINGEKATDRYEIKIRSKDGKNVPVEINANAIEYEGRPADMAVIRDITERKRAENALKASEKNFCNSLDSSSMGIRIMGDAEYTLYANQALLDMFGYKNIDELRASPPQEHYTPESYVGFSKRKEQFARGEALPDELEIDIIHNDGDVRHLQLSSRHVLWDGKQQHQIVYSDITDQKKSELLLKDQKALTDRILESTPNAVAVVGQDYRIIIVNKAFEDIFKLTKNEVESREIGEIIPIPNFIEIISQTLVNSKSQFQVELRLERGIAPRILIADIINMQKNEILVVIHDVTDEREMQERLYLTDRLASLGEMAAGIAHEINNPLTGVIALSQVMLDSGVPADIKDDLESILSEGQRAASVVRNLLSFARSHKLSSQPVEINAIINQVLNLRAYEHNVNNIKVVTHLGNNFPNIIADPFQMQQVFLNIVLNAEQAMIESHDKGNLTVTTEKLHGIIKISFADDGPGIPTEIINRIFDPFFTTKEVGKGTGLGLSICYGIITKQGGRIYADSQLGKGAIFIIELPIKRPLTDGNTKLEITSPVK